MAAAGGGGGPRRRGSPGPALLRTIPSSGETIPALGLGT